MFSLSIYQITFHFLHATSGVRERERQREEGGEKETESINLIKMVISIENRKIDSEEMIFHAGMHKQ